jgi:hypothetical protein
MSRNVFFLFLRLVRLTVSCLSKRVQSTFFQSRKCFLKVFENFRFPFLSFACQDVKNLFVVAGAKYHLYTSSFLIFFLYSQLQPLTRWKHAFDSAIFFSFPPSSYREERTLWMVGFYINATFYNRFSLVLSRHKLISQHAKIAMFHSYVLFFSI